MTLVIHNTYVFSVVPRNKIIPLIWDMRSSCMKIFHVEMPSNHWKKFILFKLNYLSISDNLNLDIFNFSILRKGLESWLGFWPRSVLFFLCFSKIRPQNLCFPYQRMEFLLLIVLIKIEGINFNCLNTMQNLLRRWHYKEREELLINIWLQTDLLWLKTDTK